MQKGDIIRYDENNTSIVRSSLSNWSVHNIGNSIKAENIPTGIHTHTHTHNWSLQSLQNRREDGY